MLDSLRAQLVPILIAGGIIAAIIGAILTGIFERGNIEFEKALETEKEFNQTQTSIAVDNSKTPKSTNTDTPVPTITITSLPKPTNTPTLSGTLYELTVQAEILLIQTEVADQLTQTATQWTLTPSFTPTSTPNTRTTAEARLTQDIQTQIAQSTLDAIVTNTQQAIDATHTATQWTATPTNTPEPPTPTDDPLELAMNRAQAGVKSNEEWETWYPEGFVREFDEVKMVLVPDGCFTIGSSSGDEDEKNGNQVCLGSFWMDQMEVSRAEYQKCVDANYCEVTPSSQNSTESDQPVNRVSWFQATAYCKWRNARLLSEAEWEYAARGPDNLNYPWGNTWNPDYANWNGDNSTDGMTSVGSYYAGKSWVGAFDMSGNAWEWTYTIYRDYPYSMEDGREDDMGDNPDVKYVLRGGSFSNEPFGMRSADRYAYYPFSMSENDGIRCARS